MADCEADTRGLQPAAFASGEGVDADSERFCRVGGGEVWDEYQWLCEIDVF